MEADKRIRLNRLLRVIDEESWVGHYFKIIESDGEVIFDGVANEENLRCLGEFWVNKIYPKFEVTNYDVCRLIYVVELAADYE